MSRINLTKSLVICGGKQMETERETDRQTDRQTDKQTVQTEEVARLLTSTFWGITLKSML